jgi:CheY-like chemotaxis protein
LVVFELYGREVGLLVRNIIDAHPLQGDLDTSVLEDPFLLGTMEFDGRVILMLDSMMLFDHAFPQWSQKSRLDRPLGEAPQVLFVDDSSFYQKVVKKYLTDAGLKADLADDGVMGLEKVKEKKYDLLIFDFEMPNMDGLELVEEVRKLGTCDDVPILVLTSLTGGRDREKLMTSGIQSYLVKLNKEELLSETHRLLELDLATV